MIAGVGICLLGAAGESASAPVAAAVQPAAASITTLVTPERPAAGATASVSGTLAGPAGPLAGELLELQSAEASGSGAAFVNVAHTFTAPDGHYSFPPLRVSRDTRFRVADVGVQGRTGASVEVRIKSPTYPSARRVLAASGFLEHRAGRAAFAIINDQGRLAGFQMHSRFHSASVVKSMLLVAYLRLLSREHRSLEDSSKGLLYPMIHSSDNDAATAVLAAVGEGGLDAVARDAHMIDYQPGGGTWGFTEVSAADLARFFFHQDAMIPPRFVDYARWLLSTIEPSESWGIPAVARPEFKVFFKGGWLPEVEGLVDQAARLERPGITFAMAVLSTHDPSMAYGEHSIEGVTARLLGRAG